jgi:hypothetical protein
MIIKAVMIFFIKNTQGGREKAKKKDATIYNNGKVEFVN